VRQTSTWTSFPTNVARGILQHTLHYSYRGTFYDRKVQQLSHYLLIEKLGGGSAGVVYKAQDRRQGRTVALKVIRKGSQYGKAKEQFERELLASQQLEHPHIAGIETVETLGDGQLLVVMPFLAGKTVDKLLVPISFKEALNIIEQTAKGLAHAHAQGILHCDIKPANLMLIKGQIKILDFGLSRLHDEEAEGERVGTLEYMSPEAARGQKLNTSSDLWSLGVVFYELLTGQSPFRATTAAAVLRNIAELEPQPISHVRSSLPEDINVVLQKLLSKKVRSRYSSAEELLFDLAVLREGKQLAKTHNTQKKVSSPKTKTSIIKLPEKPELLLGRDDELALLSLYLQDPECRLLTLQGMGGIGKTHLSLWATHEQVSFEQGSFDAVHFVELAPVSESGFVGALAKALDVEGDVTLDAVARTIGKRKQLLVLDNFEHLTSRVFMLEKLLESCPNLKLFITTRERLALDDEWVVPLQGLSFPTLLPAADEARKYAALAFFELRAKRHDKAFDIAKSLENVYAICSRLRGHPLGISLATAMLDKLSVHELAKKLEQNFELLQNGVGRHRSLKAIFDQSYELLTPKQQQLLASLGVFEGGFELEAARVITGATSQELDTLLDRSLLELSIEGRYTQHPVLHSFCKEKLGERDDEITRRYEHYFLEQLKTFRVMLRGTEQSKAFERLEKDFANLRYVIESQTEELSADVAEPFRAFYTHKGRYTEGWELFSKAKGEYAQVCAAWFALMLGNLEEAIQLGTETLKNNDAEIRLLALNTRAGLLTKQNRTQESKTISLEALALAQSLNNISMAAIFTNNLAVLEERLGNFSEATRYYNLGLSLSEKVKNNAQSLTILNNLADLYLSKKDVNQAKLLLEKALLLSEKSKLYRMKPLLQANFGLCLYAQADYIHAEAAYRDAYQALFERGDEAMAASVKSYIGQTIAAKGDRDNAKNVLWEALHDSKTLGYVTGMLSAVVRFAEILAHENNPYAKQLAALVYHHPHTDPDDRNLAEKLAEGATTTLTLEEAVEQLLQMKVKEPLASS
jgi:serine/threonine protein kinase/tetratricopeptide (TPR) repeat protein